MGGVIPPAVSRLSPMLPKSSLPVYYHPLSARADVRADVRADARADVRADGRADARSDESQQLSNREAE